jgi:hypothetical protein
MTSILAPAPALMVKRAPSRENDCALRGSTCESHEHAAVLDSLMKSTEIRQTHGIDEEHCNSDKKAWNGSRSQKLASKMAQTHETP